MGRIINRIVIPAFFLVGVGTLVYVLFNATQWGKSEHIFSRYATGSLSKLDFVSNPPDRPTGKFFAPDGSDMSLSDREGKVLVVNLWATWCPPCVEEMPTLAALQRERGSERFEVMAVSVDQMGDGEYAASELRRLTRGDLAFYHDPNYALPYDLAVRGFPTTVIYDAAGDEVARLSGEADWGTPEVVSFVDALLALDHGETAEIAS